MIYTIDEIKERIRPVAEKYNLPAVYLFGSYARGEADEKSDIDLMIDRTNTGVIGMFKLGGVYDDFDTRFEKSIDMITTDVLHDSKDKYFLNNLKKDMVNIYAR
ncbi:MAG: nucleotidyltransferase domain-containing protein [Ruminococcus sp.]|jgi:predicted nucleotidyltransferase|nr:nucleotidyltransferase domain-containing protein [Ruminococcus sp.]